MSAAQAVEPHEALLGLGVSVQVSVPLQVRVMQSDVVQVMGVPSQVLPPH